MFIYLITFPLRGNLHARWKAIRDGVLRRFHGRETKSFPALPVNCSYRSRQMRDLWLILPPVGYFFALRWQLWANKPVVEAAVGPALARRVMMRRRGALCAQTFAIRHNDAHCHSSDVFSTSALISSKKKKLKKMPVSCLSFSGKKKKKKVQLFYVHHWISPLIFSLTACIAQLRFNSERTE